MKLTLRFIGPILIVCFTLVLAHKAVPTPTVEPAYFDGLGKCGEVPCYFGIVPGQTSWDEAYTRLSNVPGLAFDSETDMGRNFHSVNLEVRVDRNTSTGPVSHLILTPPIGSQNPIGVLLSRYGSPCGFLPDLLLERMVFFYPGISATVLPANADEVHHPMPTSPIFSVALFDGTHLPPCSDTEKSVQRWRGFRRY